MNRHRYKRETRLAVSIVITGIITGVIAYGIVMKAVTKNLKDLLPIIVQEDQKDEYVKDFKESFINSCSGGEEYCICAYETMKMKLGIDGLIVVSTYHSLEQTLPYDIERLIVASSIDCFILTNKNE